MKMRNYLIIYFLWYRYSSLINILYLHKKANQFFFVELLNLLGFIIEN